MNWFHALHVRRAVNLDNVTEISRTDSGVTVYFCDDSDPAHFANDDARTLWDLVTGAAWATTPADAPTPETGWPFDEPEYHTTEPTPIEALGEPPADAVYVDH
jgi:hypothetical protein